MPSPFKTLVVRNPFVDEYEQFEDLAVRCKDAGITHLTFTEIPRSYWEIDDPEDPYLQWSIVHTSLFKIFPPELLQDWVPHDYCRQAQETIAKRAQILNRVGMRGAAFLYDPLYWPESVFDTHPQLRGPRVDHPRRSRHIRFAPCTDRPEVLQYFAQAFRRLYDLSGGALDLIVMRTNDSGTGFCWSHLYDQPNGPEACRHIGAIERASHFMQTCLEALKEAGGDVTFYLQGTRIAGSGQAAIDSFLHGVPENCGCYIHQSNAIGGKRILSANPDNFPTFPLKGIPNHVEVLEQLSQASEKGFPHLIFFTRPTMYGSAWDGDPKTTATIAAFNRQPHTDLVSKIGLTRELAASLYGEENANDVVSAWWSIHHAGEILKKNETGMNMILLGCLGERWLTRPFVVFPEELTDEERTHYRIHLFQAGPRHESYDLLDCQGNRQFGGERHLDYFLKHFADACGKYSNAQRRLAEAAARKGPNHAELKQQVAAMDLLRCFLANIRNCVNFQIRVESVKQRLQQDPQYCHSQAILGKRAEISHILRSEMDNTMHLIQLLEQNAQELIVLAGSDEEETPFLLGPELVGDLRKKREIMMRHWPDIDRLIAPPNL